MSVTEQCTDRQSWQPSDARGVSVATLTVVADAADAAADDVGDSETLPCIVVAIATRRCFL